MKKPKPYAPTTELRFLRQIQHVSTVPSDMMQVVIGKQYPTQAVQKCFLQQKWTNGIEEIWRDIEIVDDKQITASSSCTTPDSSSQSTTSHSFAKNVHNTARYQLKTKKKLRGR